MQQKHQYDKNEAGEPHFFIDQIAAFGIEAISCFV